MNNLLNGMRMQVNSGSNKKQQPDLNSNKLMVSANIVIKRILMISAFIVFGTSLSFAQFQIGVVAGLNTSTQSGLGDIWDNSGIRCNINSGFMGYYRINDWFALKSGVLYSQKGTSLNVKQNAVDVKQVDKFSYIEIPLKAELSSKSGVKNHRLFASVGPYAAFLVDSKRKFNHDKTDLKNQTYDTDFGISWELGVDIPFSKNNIQIYLNYDMGLSEVAEYDKDLRNKSLSLNVGWFFN